MTTLATDKVRPFDMGHDPQFNEHPVVATDIIYRGAAVSLDASGNAKPLAGTDTKFAGFAWSQADNSTGSAGDKRVRVLTRGAVEVPVVGVDGGDDVTKKVYASDDDTFTLTSTSNKLIGKVIRHVSGTTCLVAFEADALDAAT